MERKDRKKKADDKSREPDETRLGDLPEKPLTDDETNVKGGLANVDLQNTL